MVRVRKMLNAANVIAREAFRGVLQERRPKCPKLAFHARQIGQLRNTMGCYKRCEEWRYRSFLQTALESFYMVASLVGGPSCRRLVRYSCQCCEEELRESDPSLRWAGPSAEVDAKEPRSSWTLQNLLLYNIAIKCQPAHARAARTWRMMSRWTAARLVGAVAAGLLKAGSGSTVAG